MSRVQLALNVNDIDEAVAFYATLFGTEPAKRRPGYANFAIAEPPLKLVLLENPGQGGSLNHLGVEVADTTAVDAEHGRLSEAGLAPVGGGGTGRRAGGGLHGPRRQPALLGRGRRAELAGGRGRAGRRSPGGPCGRAGRRAGLAVLRGRAGGRRPRGRRASGRRLLRLTGQAPCRKMEA